MFLYKTILGINPSYLSCLVPKNQGSHNLTSMDVLQFVVPKIPTKLSKKALVSQHLTHVIRYNSLQSTLSVCMNVVSFNAVNFTFSVFNLTMRLPS